MDAGDLAVVAAAGTLPWRRQNGGLEVAVVHRPRYDDWSWPKGKLDEGEGWPEAAVRETREETGLAVRLGLPLPRVRYRVRSSTGMWQDKAVRYWAAPIVGDDAELRHEVDEVRWLAPEDASDLLTYGHDRRQLAALTEADAEDRLAVWPLLLIRHAKALPRRKWSGKDWLRPLDQRGAAQARDLAGVLAAYQVRHLVTSCATRCVDTVRPYALAAGAVLDPTRALSEEGHDADSEAAARRLEAALADGDGGGVAVCTHGPLVPDLLSVLARRFDPSADWSARDWQPLAKGETLVAHVRGTGDQARVVSVERHLPLL